MTDVLEAREVNLYCSVVYLASEQLPCLLFAFLFILFLVFFCQRLKIFLFSRLRTTIIRFIFKAQFTVLDEDMNYFLFGDLNITPLPPFFPQRNEMLVGVRYFRCNDEVISY